MTKKLISLILSSIMLLNLITVLPINAFAASGSSKTYEKDGYSVTYIVGNEWDKSQTIYITLKNTGEEPILNWALKYDNIGSVSNIWNAYAAETTDEYVIVKNNGYNFEIAPDQSVSFGYTLSYEEKAMPEDFEIYSRRIEVKSGYDVEFNVTDDWYTGFQGEISVSNTSNEPIEAWMLSFDGNFDITNIWNAKLISNENRAYKTAAELWTNPINPKEKVTFGFSASKSATDNIIADNFKLTAVVIGESKLENDPEKEPEEDIDYELDIDNDGLPDYYEDILGTDKNISDTDNDGIPDGYEVFYLGTDPTKADSDDNGKNDGDEDFDNDGLSNKKEYELGTDPNNADTDGDGLSDGTEINTHGTDPLKYDTDDDGISDGDELKLGLDPKNSSTDGTPDSERTFPQTVFSDSEVFSEINNDEETPFKVSLEITAAGVAENNVYAHESGYSNAIENSAIIGIAPEFVYTDGLAVEEVTVKFELDNSAVSNTLGTYAENNDGFKGINRLMVFMFFEDVNMLLPVETEYDETNNIVLATTDRVGTYCLVDMELFFQNLGIEPDNSVNSVDKIELMAYNGNDDTADSVYKDNFDVVFMVDEINYSNDELSVICDKIYDTSKAIFNTSSNVSVRIYGLNGKNKQTGCDFYGRSDTIDGVESILKKVSHTELTADDLIDISRATSISEAVDYVALSYIISNINDEQFEANFNGGMSFSEAVKKASELGIKFDHEEFGFIFFDAERTNCNINGFETLFSIGSNSYNIKQSIISNVPGIENEDEYKYSYARVLFDETEGKNFDIAANREVFVEDVLKYIYGTVPTQAGAYNAIIATGYSTVVLDKPLTEHDMELAEKLYNNPEYAFSEEEVKDCADTDGDGLLDFEEVMFFANKLGNCQLIKFEDNEIKLPSVNKIIAELDEIAYVQSGLLKAKIQYRDCFDEFLCLTVLPVISDPTNEDSDNDGLLDGKVQEYNGKIIAPQDKEPLKPNGPSGVWSRYINEMSSSEVPHLYSNPFMKIDWGSVMANGIIKSPFATMAGADLLNFDFDEQHMALHAHPFTWQWIGGYTDFYDSVFEWATGGNMDNLKLEFTNNKNELYYLWCWRGDYINLGSGAEIGIYKKSFISGEAYATFTLPMTLSLYNYNENGIDTVFNWAPDKKQWWITGWNPEYMEPNKYELVMLGSIDFTGHEDMYDSLIKNTKDGKDSDKIVYDDESLTVWIIWHEIIQ